jgi:hypothetical protein
LEPLNDDARIPIAERRELAIDVEADANRGLSFHRVTGLRRRFTWPAAAENGQHEPGNEKERSHERHRC